MTTGIFVDTANLYYKLNKKYNSKLDYAAYLNQIDGLILRAYAYVSQQGTEAAGFLTCLQDLKFVTRCKRPRLIRFGDAVFKSCDWSCQLTLDAVDADVGRVILGSSDPDLVPLVRWLQEQGLVVCVFACSIPRCLVDAADEVIEITEDLLEDYDGI